MPSKSPSNPATKPQSAAKARHSDAGGDDATMRTLFAELYPDIKRLARVRLSQVGGLTGLNATALVHEGFMRMAENNNLPTSSRLQFFAYVGKVLRSVVIDFVREKHTEKRGGGVTLLTMSHADAAPSPWLEGADLIDLDRALEALKALDERLYQIVEMHVFSGLTVLEVSVELGASERTVGRDLAKARLLLAKKMAMPERAGTPSARDASAD